MTVTVDAATENVRTDTTSPQTFSHAGAASGVKGVLLAIVHGTSATDHVSAASYGGVAMARRQRNTDTANEPGAAEWWFLGASVPQGTQTVSYTPGATTDDIHAVCITLLGAANLTVVDTDGVNDNVANPSVTLQYGGKTSMAFGALYGGGVDGSAFTPNANCTTIHDHDLGAFYSEIIRQTTAGSADFAVGGTSGTDDVAFAAIAVTDVGQIVAVGLVEETDSALAVGKAKTKAIGLNTETDEALAAGRVKTMATGIASETDEALAAGRNKTLVIGLTTETDEALPLVGDQTVPIGLAEETDAALALGRLKSLAVGLVDETDSALAFGRLKTLVVGIATSVESALAAQRTKALAAGIATETDSALAVSRRKTREIGLATETDEALAADAIGGAGGGGGILRRLRRSAFRAFRVGP